ARSLPCDTYGVQPSLSNHRRVAQMFFQRKLACSFCGKTAAQVTKLVAGRRAYICDACTAEAQRLMSGSDGARRGSPQSPARRSLPYLWRRLVRRGDRGDGESMSMKPAQCP